MLQSILLLILLSTSYPCFAQDTNTAKDKDLVRRLDEISKQVARLKRDLDKNTQELGLAQKNLSVFFHADEPLIGEILKVDHRERTIYCRNVKTNQRFTYLITIGTSSSNYKAGTTHNFGDCKQIDPANDALTYIEVITTVYERRWQEREAKLLKEKDKIKWRIDVLEQQKNLAGTYQLKNNTQLFGIPTFRNRKIIFEDVKEGKKYTFEFSDLDSNFKPNQKLVEGEIEYRRLLTAKAVATNSRRLGLKPKEIKVLRLRNGREFSGQVIEIEKQHIVIRNLANNKVANLQPSQLDEGHWETKKLIEKFRIQNNLPTSTPDDWGTSD